MEASNKQTQRHKSAEEPLSKTLNLWTLLLTLSYKFLAHDYGE